MGNAGRIIKTIALCRHVCYYEKTIQSKQKGEMIMSLWWTGAMATLAAVNGSLMANGLRDGKYGLATVSGLATAFSIAAAVGWASDVNNMEDQFNSYETLIEQGEFDQENAQSVCGSIEQELQKAYEAKGGEKKLTFSCGLK